MAGVAGASDDGAGCAVLLEVLRALAAARRPLRHDAVFLFNGAEENILQASHAFITQHKYRSLASRAAGAAARPAPAGSNACAPQVGAGRARLHQHRGVRRGRPRGPVPGRPARPLDRRGTCRALYLKLCCYVYMLVGWPVVN